MKKIKNKLLGIREKRPKPFFDDKTQIDLNAYWISVLIFVAEVFTGSPGKLVDLEATIKGFDAICKGEYDHLPEAAFYMVGTIEEVVEKAEKMAKDAAA